MRRLRRGQAGGAAPAPADTDLDAGANDGDLPRPPAGSAPAAAHQTDAMSESIAAADGVSADDEYSSSGDDLPDHDEPFAVAPAAATTRADSAGAPAPAVPVRQLLMNGQLAASRVAIEAGDETDLASVVEALTEGEAVLRGLGLGGDDPETSVMLAPSPRARGMLVVFGEDGGGFFLAPPLTEPQLHTLYVRDEKRSLAMLGVEGLGADYDACLLSILRIARALGVADLFCLGGGAACYSALRYGLDLGAAGVLAAGTLDDVRRGVQAPGLRPGMQARRLMRLAAELGPSMPDAYEAAATRPGLVLCRPGQGALARLSALPGTVSVDAPPGALGRIWEWAEQSGQLRGMVRDLLTCRAVE